ncbi:MAG TPA: FliI/YscN family ATPase [Elusimicrobiota bacterium]|nr:FliI/YscN family ATPase [Elusimicrobiota bacterium]HNA59701.1 FliI/YscN family ATPase [Elusimicrobiota bacterium]HND63522.1 FliI/YscN family ATPase [Elusimicrobiota bacterium]HNI55995.1 FliI/YscN family ATPase [Elusimicrobiota bacterium]
MGDIDWAKYVDVLGDRSLAREVGRLTRVTAGLLEGVGPDVSLGEVCRVWDKAGKRFYWAEAVGFRDDRIVMAPLGHVEGLGPGSFWMDGIGPVSVPVGDALLGRVVDARGAPLDGGRPLALKERRPLRTAPPDPMSRRRIAEPLATGVRAIDGLMTCGKGQRLGLFAGSGVGKSSLLGMIARGTQADVNVISLVGERGREVREFIEKDLGPEGLARSVVVVATSDQPPMARLHAALGATAVAEYFAEQGRDVLLMMDSVTRLAMAGREIGLALGEPPTTKGYTPSVFSFLPRLLERAGNFSRGSVTGIYTVLVEADDMDDPVADTLRSILDGHVVLSRRMATQNHYPAVDVLESLSRLMVDVTEAPHRRAAGILREVLAAHREAEDLLRVGAYARGSDAKIDFALAHLEKVKAFLKQDMNEKSDFPTTRAKLGALFA